MRLDFSPASITNGISPTPSSGATAAQVEADLKTLAQTLLTTGNDLSSGAWVMNPRTALSLSLLRDAYVAWDEERVLDWAIRYWERAREENLPVPSEFADFYRDFDWMGAQRQLKVLGIFSRLYLRDGKDGYLKDQPVVMRYLRATCQRYRELAGLARLLEEFEPTEKRVGYTF